MALCDHEKNNQFSRMLDALACGIPLKTFTTFIRKHLVVSYAVKIAAVFTLQSVTKRCVKCFPTPIFFWLPFKPGFLNFIIVVKLCNYNVLLSGCIRYGFSQRRIPDMRPSSVFEEDPHPLHLESMPCLIICDGGLCS